MGKFVKYLGFVVLILALAVSTFASFTLIIRNQELLGTAVFIIFVIYTVIRFSQFYDATKD